MTIDVDWSVARPARRGEAWVQRERDQTAVYNPETEMLHLLNPSAVAIWELCDGDTSPTEMAEAIDELTGLGPETSAADVESALTSLLIAGLVEIQDGYGGGSGESG